MGKRIAFMTLVAVAFSMGQDCSPDTDGDGVPDVTDGCPVTPICADVDAVGCPSDDDDDGVHNGCDECPNTPDDTVVYANGCEAVIDDDVPPSCQGPDLRAREIEYSLVNRTGPTTADILIKGVADNIGLADYLSGEDQQSLQLLEDGTMVAQQEFVNLTVGETVSVEYQRSWSIDPAGAEFQPRRYALMVAYDPDILDDGNLNNDECSFDNNLILRGTTGIRSLFE